MQVRFPRLLHMFAVAVLVSAGFAGVGHAQVKDGIATPGAPDGKAQRLKPTREKAPSALPGARAEPDVVAPPSRNAPDLPPTEALFDAINRGDLPMAKDAVNRGADIHGKSVLGLTPIELSVDLGRNQITFMLLSLRGNAGFSTTSGPEPTQGPGAPTGRAANETNSRAATRAERRANQRAEREARKEAAREARASRTATADEPGPRTPQAPRLFQGGGGAPIPQAGFLGFDGRH